MTRTERMRRGERLGAGGAGLLPTRGGTGSGNIQSGFGFNAIQPSSIQSAFSETPLQVAPSSSSGPIISPDQFLPSLPGIDPSFFGPDTYGGQLPPIEPVWPGLATPPSSWYGFYPEPAATKLNVQAPAEVRPSSIPLLPPPPAEGTEDPEPIGILAILLAVGGALWIAS